MEKLDYTFFSNLKGEHYISSVQFWKGDRISTIMFLSFGKKIITFKFYKQIDFNSQLEDFKSAISGKVMLGHSILSVRCASFINHAKNQFTTYQKLNSLKVIPTKRKANDYKTYVMKDSLTGLYKIGKSINPKFREKTLQSEKPSIKMIKVFDSNIEKQLHKLFDNSRVRGEWFSLNKIQLKFICTQFN